jgi:hypothetical protein
LTAVPEAGIKAELLRRPILAVGAIVPNVRFWLAWTSRLAGAPRALVSKGHAAQHRAQPLTTHLMRRVLRRWPPKGLASMPMNRLQSFANWCAVPVAKSLPNSCNVAPGLIQPR